MAIAFTPAGSATMGTSEYSCVNGNTSGIASSTTAAMVQAAFNLANLAAGDEFQFRVYEKINGGSQVVVYEARRVGAQSEPLVTPALLLGEGWDVTIKKIAGTDRAIAYRLANAS